ncbi:MAG: head GIN domain-containing protein [Chitinophagaceae bacterium]
MKKTVLSLRKWALLPALLFAFFSCKKDDLDHSPVIEEDVQVSGFTRVNAGAELNVIITKGAAFAIKARGEANYVHDLEFSVADNTLEIQYQTYVQNRPQMDIYITLPTLTSTILSGAATGTVAGFQGVPHVISAVLSGASNLTMNGTGVNMNVEISGASTLTVTGATADLYGNISGGGKLKAYGLTATEVDISASGGATAQVQPVDALFASASGGSRIYYKGNPGVKNIETSGGGQVIKE